MTVVHASVWDVAPAAEDLAAHSPAASFTSVSESVALVTAKRDIGGGGGRVVQDGGGGRGDTCRVDDHGIGDIGDGCDNSGLGSIGVIGILASVGELSTLYRRMLNCIHSVILSSNDTAAYIGQLALRSALTPLGYNISYLRETFEIDFARSRKQNMSIVYIEKVKLA